MSKEPPSVWIKTDLAVDGSTYVVTIEASEDRSLTLTPDSALRYASTVLAHVARAEYDAAVVRQLESLVADPVAAAQMVKDLREDRPPISHDATFPLTFENGVSAHSGKPFIRVAVDGKRLGQWAIPDAKAHALGVLESVSVADLDAGYYRVLRGVIGLEENPARGVVGDLSRWRVDE